MFCYFCRKIDSVLFRNEIAMTFYLLYTIFLSFTLLNKTQDQDYQSGLPIFFFPLCIWTIRALSYAQSHFQYYTYWIV